MTCNHRSSAPLRWTFSSWIRTFSKSSLPRNTVPKFTDSEMDPISFAFLNSGTILCQNRFDWTKTCSTWSTQCHYTEFFMVSGVCTTILETFKPFCDSLSANLCRGFIATYLQLICGLSDDPFCTLSRLAVCWCSKSAEFKKTWRPKQAPPIFRLAEVFNVYLILIWTYKTSLLIRYTI